MAGVNASGRGRRAAAGVLAAAILGGAIAAAELQPKTVKAFETYVAEAESRAATPFLWLDTLPAATRGRHLTDLRAGGLLIERLRV